MHSQLKCTFNNSYYTKYITIYLNKKTKVNLKYSTINQYFIL